MSLTVNFIDIHQQWVLQAPSFKSNMNDVEQILFFITLRQESYIYFNSRDIWKAGIIFMMLDVSVRMAWIDKLLLKL